MNRMGGGYSFDVIRARRLIEDDAGKDARTTIPKKVKTAATPRIALATSFPSPPIHAVRTEERTACYWASVSTLARTLEACDFA
jgi:hypothetical protein